ncbi:hypothetical protein X474_21435 [Dethiosulfatarculus sandiegensis]|uniref:Uncharacterized protein n=1 Tax=Dethiosulfatarculus sandiegensis TaxID=1429043 RepID=A0A0D2J1B0_9BACT|nr:hypothetical protein X474_21435 [Dethiosulfatarculus sandiegensis]
MHLLKLGIHFSKDGIWGFSLFGLLLLCAFSTVCYYWLKCFKYSARAGQMRPFSARQDQKTSDPRGRGICLK